jgi:3-hydroxyisobutyrate dehydrogenase-like beta-hydroxyacid dehydrogenase
MALNLIKAGFELTVHNRTADKCRPLIEAGANQARSPSEVAGVADTIITIVSDTPDVESLLFGEDGIRKALRKGHVVVDMSTISPTLWISTTSQERREMLDAPVTGGEKGAIEGSLAIMVGGRRETFDRCLPIFQALGKTIVYAGTNGTGQTTKLVNQILCAQHIVAMVDGLRFARLAGLDLEPR